MSPLELIDLICERDVLKADLAIATAKLSVSETRAEALEGIVTSVAEACGEYPGLGRQVRDLLMRSLDDVNAATAAAAKVAP